MIAPSRRQDIIWSSAGILLIETLGTRFSEILSKIHTFLFNKKYLKMLSAQWLQLCLGLNVLSSIQHSENTGDTKYMYV